MKTRFFDHIDLRVSNLQEADAFYGIILPALGFPLRTVEANGISYDTMRDHEKPDFISLVEDTGHVPNKTRIAFWCDTKAEVDEFSTVLPQNLAKNVEGPAFWPEYSPGYYAIFFEDPCGNCLEVCCRVAI